MSVIDVMRVTQEIREQLSSEKRRLGFFLGAGTSMAVGLPGIQGLTAIVGDAVPGAHAATFNRICKPGMTVEHVLDRLRLYRELLGDDEEMTIDGITGATSAKQLDMAICQAIAAAVSGVPKELRPHLIFGQWLRKFHTHRDAPVELFTTNYDLNLERTLEANGIPYFDGFVGSVQPFFAPECLESEAQTNLPPPPTWMRLWKLHGSVNWHLESNVLGRAVITRRSDGADNSRAELAIFPTRDKYVQSRRLPFIAFQDRLRHYICHGEVLLIVLGYSFGDAHLNDLLLQGLRSNPRAAVVALLYAPPSEELRAYARELRNLSLYGPTGACIGGVEHDWGTPASQDTPVWNAETEQFTLGDFNLFTQFLETFMGSVLPEASIISSKSVAIGV